MRLCCILLVALAALPACRRQEATEATAAAAEARLTPAQLSFLKFAPVAEVEGTSLAELNGTIEFALGCLRHGSQVILGRLLVGDIGHDGSQDMIGFSPASI